jgi:Immunoglobulin I-set domain
MKCTTRITNAPRRTRLGTVIGLIIAGLLFCAGRIHGQTVSLAWNPAASGAAGYYIYYGTNSGSYYAKLDVGLNIVANITGLTAGQTYYFVVTAYNSARFESLPSNQASFVVPTTPSALAPQLTAVSPSAAPPGAQVLIYGANFTTTGGVQFAGVSAPFTVSTGGFVTATVPAGAVSGPLVITTPNGVASFNFTVLPATPPANDNFNNAQVLSGANAMASANTMGATKQSGEPNHAGNAGGHSVWYRWTAPSTGTWSLDTIGSSFNTLLAVYTGSALNNLSVVASNLSAGTLTNSITFTASGGVTYQIAVDGYNGAAGNAVLHLTPIGTTVTVYSTGFEAANGFFSTSPLAGHGGWLASGTAATGIKVNGISGYGQQGFIGFNNPVPSSSTLTYVPLNYSINTNSAPLVQFSVLMQINAPVVSSFNSVFGWVVRNASGQQLFSISFDDYTKAVSYTLDNGAGPESAGTSFNNSMAYNLVITMDFSRNTWSASLNSVTVVTAEPITTIGSALTLGDIDASDTIRQPSNPGTDGMLFDNYTVTAGPALAPAILQGPTSQTLAAGNTAFLGALVSGAPPLSYQWYTNNSPVPNATNSSLFLAGVSSAQAENYALVVSNFYGTASAYATLAVTNPPPRSLFAAPVSLNAGGALLSLNVAAGNNYRFQMSTNLQNWVTLGSFFAMSTNALCFDPSASNTAPCRFYRLVSP